MKLFNIDFTSISFIFLESLALNYFKVTLHSKFTFRQDCFFFSFVFVGQINKSSDFVHDLCYILVASLSSPNSPSFFFTSVIMLLFPSKEGST